MIVGFEVFMAVTKKNAVFWDAAPCGFIINRSFGGTCLLHLQGRRNNESFYPEEGSDTFLRNVGKVVV
jgi:hypothetical protein